MVDATWETTCVQIGFPGSQCPDSSGLYSDRLATDNPTYLQDRTTRAGAYAGAQLQWQAIVFGVEGDIAYANSEMTKGGLPGAEDPTSPGRNGPDAITVTAEWDGSVRGKLGLALSPTMLVFATGGLSWMKIEASAFCGIEFSLGGWCSPENVGRTDTRSKVLQGWTWGAGFESMLTSSLILRGEYRYAEYDTLSDIVLDGNLRNADALAFDLDTETEMFALGLAFKF
jgi:outer membrane immunogenic protein